MRVQQIRALVPDTAETRACVAVATPERCPRKFRAVRSAQRIERAEPSTTAMTSPEAEKRLRAVPGIGPWSSALVVSEALGDPDVVPVGDYHLPNTVAWALAGEARANDRRC